MGRGMIVRDCLGVAVEGCERWGRYLDTHAILRYNATMMRHALSLPKHERPWYCYSTCYPHPFF